MNKILLGNDYSIIGNIILAILLCGVVFLVLLFIRKIITTILDSIEMSYAYFSKRPIFVHFYLFRRKLSSSQIKILEKQFPFYMKLGTTHKAYFQHRIANFIKRKSFEGRQGFKVTEEVKILVSAIAVMLTFGFRKYNIAFVQRIIFYPNEFQSRFGKDFHKGEFNPGLKTVVLAWDSFIEGIQVQNDKLNLGIHEFAHAIHFNSMKQEDINSIIFVDTFNKIRDLLSSNPKLKEKLRASNLLRSYAFTNDSELLAVIIETFIETPQEFENSFPHIYNKVKQMLNFNFAGY